MFAKEDEGALDVSAKFDVDEDIFFTGEIILSLRGRSSIYSGANVLVDMRVLVVLTM